MIIGIGCGVEDLVPELLELRALLNQESLEEVTDQDHPHSQTIVLI